MDYRTPNVYVEEVSTLPPSVAGVATAVPVFIGYTEKALDNNENLTGKAIRLSTLKEYETYFGYAKPSLISVGVNGKNIGVTAPNLEYSLYYQMQMFFNNGGGACYVISVGNYSGSISKDDFLSGLEELKKEDEPTLILFPEGHLLPDANDYYDLCVEAMNQCEELKDRFTIIDVISKDKDDIKNFRNSIGMNNLKYGAAYYPYLNTSLAYSYTDDSVSVDTGSKGSIEYTNDYLKVVFKGESGEISFEQKASSDDNKDDFNFEISSSSIKIICPSSKAKRNANSMFSTWEEWNDETNNPGQKFGLVNLDESSNWEVMVDDEAAFAKTSDGSLVKLSDLKKSNTGLYNNIKTEIGKLKVVLPPGSSIAGIYAATDRGRGVWKAPANVSLNSVIGPVKKITDADQENLNVDATGGKSVNAIRSFAGKGTLVWGARTLAGNDNEWRYINVRRLFIYMEESLKKATYFAVFEPNTAMTWLKVKTMAESFLDNLWRQGGLAGSSAEKAYFVHVGLGTTMTAQDILEGRMIVEIGVAAVRPAEFIILRFSHKLQEA